jgi:S1-C subfamily serine protease
MRRRIVLAILLAATAVLHAQQTLPELRITVTVVDAGNRVRPVPRHALLISDNPSSAPPRRVVTDAEGIAALRLRPGNYTVESDEPLVFQGKAYEWRETLDVAAGRDLTLELTAAKASVTTSAAAETLSAADATPSELAMRWQESVVTIWSRTARGAGFLIDRRGLILTNQRILGTATTAEVQLTATLKVTGRVVVNDAARDVGVLWIDPSAVSSMEPMKLAYAQDGKPALARDQQVFAIDLAGIEQRALASGRIAHVDAKAIESDVRIERTSAGVPLMLASGDVIGITVPDDARTGTYNGRLQAVRIDEARAAIAEAERATAGKTPPPAAPLPVEPQQSFAESALRAAIPQRVVNVDNYSLSSADFDVTFITTPLSYASQHPAERTTGATKPGGQQNIGDPSAVQRALEDFGNWSEYVATVPPVLLIRATPKMVEGFWTGVGRQAARTQGVELPAFKHVKTSFVAMRLYCGDTEIAPIHPFKIERRLDNDSAVSEGLYAFDPSAIGSKCGKVRLVLFSEKAPDKGDERVVDTKVLEQIARDFTAAAKK